MTTRGAIYGPGKGSDLTLLTARLPDFIKEHYECHEWRHASAILSQDFPAEWSDILAVLTNFRLNKSWIAQGGGSKSKFSGWIDGFLEQRGWIEKQFRTAFEVDDARLDSSTH